MDIFFTVNLEGHKNKKRWTSSAPSKCLKEVEAEEAVENGCWFHPPRASSQTSQEKIEVMNHPSPLHPDLAPRLLFVPQAEKQAGGGVPQRRDLQEEVGQLQHQ